MKRVVPSVCFISICLFQPCLRAQHEADAEKDLAKYRAERSVEISRPTNFDERPDLAEQGMHNLNAACSRCHGRNGKGGKGPDLTTGKFRHAKSNEDLMRIMTNGIPGKGMPGLGPYEDFWWPIVAYLRTEGAKNKLIQSAPLAGDVELGYELFKKHQCASCHWTGSEGGRRGTDLSMIAATPDYVRQSLTDPDSQIDGEYQVARIVLNDGRVLQGRRLYENSHYLLIMDQHENLITIPSNSIELIARPHQSLMPSYKGVLNPKDIEDLATYVFSLRKE